MTMTMERKKYLSTISTEERNVRFALDYIKRDLKTAKLEGIMVVIPMLKTNIKVLKKRLPQKLVFQNEPYLLWECPACHFQAIKVGEKLNAFHCKNCGQRFTYDLL